MIMRAEVGDAEADRHEIQKRRVRQRDAHRAQIVAGVEEQFVGSHLEAIANQDRAAVDAAVGIGPHGLDVVAKIAVQLKKIDPQPLCRLTGSSIENVRGQSGHRLGSLIIYGVSKKYSSRLLPG